MTDQERARWTKPVADYESSEVTQREFATERGISFSNLRNWIYRLRKESRPLIAGETKTSGQDPGRRHRLRARQLGRADTVPRRVPRRGARARRRREPRHLPGRRAPPPTDASRVPDRRAAPAQPDASATRAVGLNQADGELEKNEEAADSRGSASRSWNPRAAGTSGGLPDLRAPPARRGGLIAPPLRVHGHGEQPEGERRLP